MADLDFVTRKSPSVSRLQDRNNLPKLHPSLSTPSVQIQLKANIGYNRSKLLASPFAVNQFWTRRSSATEIRRLLIRAYVTVQDSETRFDWGFALEQIDTAKRNICVRGVGTKFRTNNQRTDLIRKVKFAGLNGLTNGHGLRHTYNSTMLLAGVKVETMRKPFGHRPQNIGSLHSPNTRASDKQCFESQDKCSKAQRHHWKLP